MKGEWKLMDNQSAKPAPEYPKTLTGVIRMMKKDMQHRYGFLVKKKNVKEIKITKIDVKNATMHLWIHKTDRYQIPKILNMLFKYPFTYVYEFDFFVDDKRIGQPFYTLKSTIEINPKNIPKGITILN
ncbi:hypothetical protein AYK24_00425 [Thermoplasmatales archaeon SG8-52-4]|nr:MAG: hypothetical protein AYK24_00425 [Thermoplasmatales archaeon SG8-52-4]